MIEQPPPPVPSDAPTGYLSQDAKRRFSIIVGVLAAVCFIAQFVLPMVLWMVIGPVFMMSQMSSMKMPDAEGAALWQGRLWYTETSVDAGNAKRTVSLQRLAVDPKAKPETIADFSTWQSPSLLADSNRLWLISRRAVSSFYNGSLHDEVSGRPLGDTCRPFLLGRRPAVIEKSPSGLALRVLRSGEWSEHSTFPRLTAEDKSVDIENLVVVADAYTHHLFMKYGANLYYREGLPSEGADITDTWETVTDCGHQWAAAMGEDGPVVVASKGEGDGPWGMQTVLLERGPDGWGPVLETDVVALGDYGACAEPGTDRLVLMTAGFPGSMRIVEIRNGEITQNIRHGSGSPFPRGMMVAMMVPYSLSFLMPLVLVIAYSALMPKYRVCEHHAQGQGVPYASLWRRALAQVVDGAIAGGPTLAGYAWMMSSMFDMERMVTRGPFAMFAGFGLVFGGFAWAFLCFLIYAILEGRWGATPGKWLLRVRVVGAEDLKPCGFGRALLRGILKFVDGFFSFMVGAILIAITERWQRVGDMVARTIVIDVH